MSSVWLIFPHQLYKQNLSLPKDHTIALIEDSLFFNDYEYEVKFHKLKLVFHRATMKAHEFELKNSGRAVLYFDFQAFKNLKQVVKKLKELGFQKFHTYEPTDYILAKRLRVLLGSSVLFHTTPNYINSLKDLESDFGIKDKYKLHDFYIHQRKKHSILYSNGKPVGGRWSFDVFNRKRLPKKFSLPPDPCVKQNVFVKEAKDYVESLFPSNPGSSEKFFFSVTREDAKTWFETFLEQRLENFGAYQDFITVKSNFIFHSGIAAYLNVGLLDPTIIISKVMERVNNENLPSIEGFLRQIIGWREYMRFLYETKGSVIRKSNFFDHRYKIKDLKKFNLEPLIHCVKKVESIAYLHHIERLMVVGNILFLCEIHPDEVYKYFMQNFIDAFDWVMVPNVYSMSQFACGGILSTKPYFSGSNYILKMSDFKKGEWTLKLDGLFYRFIHKNYDKLSENPRLKPLLSRLTNSSKKNELVKVGDDYLNFLLNHGAISAD